MKSSAINCKSILRSSINKCKGCNILFKTYCLIQIVKIIVAKEPIWNLISLIEQRIVISRYELSKISEIRTLIDWELLKHVPLFGRKVTIYNFRLSILECRMRYFVIENKMARLGKDWWVQRSWDSFSNGFYRCQE